MYCPINLLFFDIPLLYYYINFRSSVIFCLSSGDYLSLGISLSYLFVNVYELLCCGCFETPVILLAILLPIKSPVASAIFLITLLEVVLSVSVADCLA